MARRSRRIRNRQPRGRRGQVLIIIVVMAIILLVMALFMFDLQGMVRTRSKTQNAVDAAALAGASWQGRSLNMIGELNLLKASTMMYAAFPVDGDTDEERFEASMDMLSEMQARISYVGPLAGYAAAQQAAKANQMRANGAYSSHLNTHIQIVNTVYPIIFQEDEAANGYAWMYPYSEMLQSIAVDGVAAKPVNSDYLIQPPQLNGQWGWLLTNQDFYSAVHGNWYCWFLYTHGLDPEAEYNFDDATISVIANYHLGSEYLPLYIDIPDVRSAPDYSVLGDFLEERGLSQIPPDDDGELPDVQWATFGYQWDDTSMYDAFNDARYLRSDFKSQYAGDGAATRFVVSADPSLITGRWTWEYGENPDQSENTSLGSSDAMNWSPNRSQLNTAEAHYESLRANNSVQSTAAAKPFGSLGESRASAAGIVLPVFTDIRLLPTSLVEETPSDAYPEFYQFLIEYFGHPDYPNVPDDVRAKWFWYISAIEKFEDSSSSFRQGLLEYAQYREDRILGPDGLLGTDDDGVDPCEPTDPVRKWPGGGGGGGGHTGGGNSRGGPPSLH